MKVLCKKENKILDEFYLRKLYKIIKNDFDIPFESWVKLLVSSDYEPIEEDELRLRNRKRCLNCKYYGRNVCPLMAEADVFKIDNCILENDEIKAIKKDSLDEFIFFKNPIEYLSYLMYKRKDKLPEVGQTVITLKSGFSSYYSGKFLKVVRVEELNPNFYQINLNDLFDEDDEEKYGVTSDDWYNQIFIL